MRQWRYNHAVPEYFVEDETTTCVRRAEGTRETTTAEGEDSNLHRLWHQKNIIGKVGFCLHSKPVPIPASQLNAKEEAMDAPAASGLQDLELPTGDVPPENIVGAQA